MIRQHVLTENNFCKCVHLNGGDCDQTLGKAETSEGWGGHGLWHGLATVSQRHDWGKPVAPKALKHLPAASWNSARRAGSVCTCPVSHTPSLVDVARQSKSGDMSLAIPLVSQHLAGLRGDAHGSKWNRAPQTHTHTQRCHITQQC